ncbi:MAG: ABC transporter ATP-binding protein [Humidesulfovibrio sp.]|uniref:ABC transporter ATP-binding protein n=1 Tax=Humidesulfovibrio sp. TaxID=2910988 RepID=UPI002736A58B|nr:ABC transporter ATP-binding protein [Humidesulfovibrio sp.]MDP2848422.1 ABC transporter ATP-binding protein [Humidesulfovibrio sp.]
MHEPQIIDAPLLEAIGITKSFTQDGMASQALKGVSLSVAQGEFVSIVGRSGSGKSTFVSVLSTLLMPDAGQVNYNGKDLVRATEAEINAIRHGDFAVIFQFHYLLPYLTALENTLLPFMRSLKPVTRAQKTRAMECLARVGLADKAHRLPGQLSGGEQQRVAIARALVKEARVLFADEPTGSLDSATGATVMELLGQINTEGLAVVMVTHNEEYARLAHRLVRMEDGLVV